MQDFENRVAIVTGTTGIGAPWQLGSRGAEPWCSACGVDSAANEEMARHAIDEGLAIEVRRVDVSQAAEVSAAVDAAIARFGALDIIVNAAAIHPLARPLRRTSRPGVCVCR